MIFKPGRKSLFSFVHGIKKFPPNLDFKITSKENDIQAGTDVTSNFTVVLPVLLERVVIWCWAIYLLQCWLSTYQSMIINVISKGLLIFLARSWYKFSKCRITKVVFPLCFATLTTCPPNCASIKCQNVIASRWKIDALRNYDDASHRHSGHG